MNARTSIERAEQQLREVLGPDRDVELAERAIGLRYAFDEQQTRIAVAGLLDLQGVFAVAHRIEGPGLDDLLRRLGLALTETAVARGSGLVLATLRLRS